MVSSDILNKHGVPVYLDKQEYNHFASAINNYTFIGITEMVIIIDITVEAMVI